MSEFLERLKAGFQTCHCRQRPLLLAVSGGADSVALLRGALAVRDELGLRVTAAHLNHNLRGADSRADVEWLQGLADRLGVRLIVGSEDVAALAEREGRTIEEAARRARYRFLEETAAREECSHIAVAHTGDDQAETILHHVLRGTGLAGLRGMPPARRLDENLVLVRPLLEASRKEVEAYLAELQQDYRDDLSNVDERFTRNRLRRSLLPLLEREFNPQVREALRRLGAHAGEAQDALNFAADRMLETVVLEQGDNLCRLQCAELVECPRHLVRECFARLWQQMEWPRQGMGFEHWERLAGLVGEEGRLELPGRVEARSRRGVLTLRRIGDFC